MRSSLYEGEDAGWSFTGADGICVWDGFFAESALKRSHRFTHYTRKLPQFPGRHTLLYLLSVSSAHHDICLASQDFRKALRSVPTSLCRSLYNTSASSS